MFFFSFLLRSLLHYDVEVGPEVETNTSPKKKEESNGRQGGGGWGIHVGHREFSNQCLIMNNKKSERERERERERELGVNY